MQRRRLWCVLGVLGQDRRLQLLTQNRSRRAPPRPPRPPRPSHPRIPCWYNRLEDQTEDARDEEAPWTMEGRHALRGALLVRSRPPRPFAQRPTRPRAASRRPRRPDAASVSTASVSIRCRPMLFSAAFLTLHARADIAPRCRLAGSALCCTLLVCLRSH